MYNMYDLMVHCQANFICNVGVQQNGIISTTLFIIYINDFVQYSNDIKFNLYANDSNIFVSDVSIENCNTNMINPLWTEFFFSSFFGT